MKKEIKKQHVILSNSTCECKHIYIIVYKMMHLIQGIYKANPEISDSM